MSGIPFSTMKKIKRKHLVKSAAYWFNSARKAQNKGKMDEALMCMENAYNHVENALAFFVNHQSYQVGGKWKFDTLQQAIAFEKNKRLKDGIFRSVEKIEKIH